VYRTTYPPYLFYILQKQRKKIEEKDTDLRGAKGIVIATLTSIALWCIIISLSIVAF
jgi:hypothetical protein